MYAINKVNCFLRIMLLVLSFLVLNTTTSLARTGEELYEFLWSIPLEDPRVAESKDSVKTNVETISQDGGISGLIEFVEYSLKEV